MTELSLETVGRHTDVLTGNALQAGANLIAVHGRTRHQSSEGHPVSLDSIRVANELVNGRVPVVANGDVWSLEDARHTRDVTGVHGVMSARGLLANPALFAGYKETPAEALSVRCSLFVKHRLRHGWLAHELTDLCALRCPTRSHLSAVPSTLLVHDGERHVQDANR